MKPKGERPMEFLTFTPQERRPELIDHLTQVWAASVRATHDFLSPEDFDAIAAQVPQALREVPSLTVAWDDGAGPVGFLGVAGHTLEMFFLAPEQIGTGLADRLFRHAMAQHYIAQITVNEQNLRALNFYLRRSYRVHHRTATDGMGLPYPILTLTLSCYG